MNNKPKFSNEAGPPASISRNPPALTIHLAWSEARLVRILSYPGLGSLTKCSAAPPYCLRGRKD
jgi:hypothetical protein